MMRTKVAFFSAMALAMLAVVPAWPQMTLEQLTQKMEALEKTNAALQQRVEYLEQRLGETSAAPAPEATPSEAPAAPAQATEAQPPADKVPLDVWWDKGLLLESPDKDFSLRIGGRILFDAAHISFPEYWKYGGPDISEHQGTDFRRLRLKLTGEAYRDLFYKLEVDFRGNGLEIIDAYLGMKNIPYAGTVQAGQFSEPIGLEALTSANYITFMERSMATQALIPYRSRGLMVSNQFLNQRLNLALGVFNDGIAQEDYWSATGRVSGLPWYRNDGRQLLHLGVGMSFRNPDGSYEFAARPAAFLANEYFDTGELPADSVRLANAELALVLGPFSVQSEFTRADLEMCDVPDSQSFLQLDDFFKPPNRHFDGYYVQGSYFLTGENRSYDKQTGVFGQIVPRRPFSIHQPGPGAVELTLRYEELALDDYDYRSGVIGGSGRAMTYGANWYLNPNFRVMLNYVRAAVDQYAYDGAEDIYEARFQANF